MTMKPFDCVEMKRQAAEKIYEQIKQMTIEEELRFWNTSIAEVPTVYAAAHLQHANTQRVARDGVKKEVGV